MKSAYTKNYVSYGVACIMTALLWSSCKQCEVGYQLEIPHTISSKHDTLSIGDTLWVAGEFSDKLYDRMSHNYFSFTDEFPFNFAVNKIIPEYVYGPKIFDFINVLGDTKVGSGLFFPKYIHQNNQYKIKFGLIAKETGTFVFSLGATPADIGYTNIDYDPKCLERV
jgi:hypothetical protein